MQISKRIKIANIQRLSVAVQQLRTTMQEKEAFWRHEHAIRPYKGFGQFSIALKSLMAENHQQILESEEAYYKEELIAFHNRIAIDPTRPRKIGTALQHYLPDQYNKVIELIRMELRRLADVSLDSKE